MKAARRRVVGPPSDAAVSVSIGGGCLLGMGLPAFTDSDDFLGVSSIGDEATRITMRREANTTLILIRIDHAAALAHLAQYGRRD